jgi:hypothetical protein
VIGLLKNLDPEFESRRAAFCHQDSLPTMEEAVSPMVIEESRLRMMSGDNPVRSAYTTVAKRLCYNYREKGHMSYNCPLPRSGTRGGHGGGRAGGCGKGNGAPQANAAMESSITQSSSLDNVEIQPITLTGEQVK